MAVLSIPSACSGSTAPRRTGVAAPTVTSTRGTAPATSTLPPTTVAPTTIPPTTVAPAPPFALSSTTLHLVDGSRATISHGRTIASTRTLTTLVWYPSTAGRWPLVVFAHGFQVGPEVYLHLCQVWAMSGYVVAAPAFPLTDPAVAGTAIDEADINQQPGDIRYVINALVDPAGQLSGRIDPQRIAVAGHSDGGETALAVGFQPGQADPRIKAVIALSVQPLTSPPAAPTPLPLLVGQGDRDTINPPGFGQAVYDEAASPRWLLWLQGAGHLPPYAGGSVWQPVVDVVTVDFLNFYVSHRASTDSALMTDGHRPGLATIAGAP
jgi:dienelactone hydrolase